MPPPRKSQPVGAAARAARAEALAKSNSVREEEAAFIFHKFDGAKAGCLCEDDLLRCFVDLGFQNGRQNKTDEEMRTWVRREIKKGDKEGTGKLSYPDFVDYYNRFVVGHRRNFEETYELGQQIGRGAFGNVFRSKKIGGVVQGGVEIGTHVAVKQVKKEPGVQMELLHNEITIWRGLDHPNLVRLLDVFEDEKMLCLVTELMRGGDLFKQLSKASTFSEAEAARLARQIVSAVAHLHEHGVVHCDLKPSNILVAEQTAERGEMTVKIADFGLSQSVQYSRGGKLTEVCGTPDYFAPELAELAQGKATMLEAAGGSSNALDQLLEEEGLGYGPPLDCWAVGCIIYEMLAGYPPYRAQDEAVLFYKITENMMEFPAALFAPISPLVIDLIKKLTATDAADRLSCAAALQHAWLVEERDSAPLPEAVHNERRNSLSTRLSAGDLASLVAAEGDEGGMDGVLGGAGDEAGAAAAAGAASGGGGGDAAGQIAGQKNEEGRVVTEWTEDEER